jgi:hypothetical protein
MEGPVVTPLVARSYDVALPLDARKGFAFPLSHLFILGGCASFSKPEAKPQSEHSNNFGKAKPFRTSGGIAAYAIR